MGVQQSSGCKPFENNPDSLLLLDQVAKRYNMHPAQVLRMSVWEISLAYACIQQHDATAAQLMQRINADSMPVFPVVVLRD